MGRTFESLHRRALSSGAAACLLLLAAAGCASNAEPDGQTGDTPVVTGPGGVPLAGAGGSGVTPIGSAGAGGSGSTGVPSPVAGAMPCEVDTVVKSRCQTCHGAAPIGGAPMSLVTLGDFQKDYAARTTTQLAGQTMKVYELARIRINRELGTMPMPQGNPLSDTDFTALNAWLVGGAQAGDACVVDPGGPVGPDPMGMAGSGAVEPPPNRDNECEGDPTVFEKLVPRDGETCYEFPTHGLSSPTDTTKFTVATGEHYDQFYYDIPWPAGTIATRFGADFDNLAVLHHWLGFSSKANTAAGTVQADVLGTTLGESAELVGGWAVGGCNVEFPPEMGLALPDTGKIMIQWHHNNSTGSPQPDGSVVQWCTLPAGGRPNIGGLTFLGTENFNGLAGMPAGQESSFSGTCPNDSGAPINIVAFLPHMHLLGVHMKSVVNGSNTVFDHAFLFDHQVHYMQNPAIVLQPGDTITSTCTFNNTTPSNVAFGQSTHAEMCYQFAFSYPHGALNNGTPSLIGATNTCW